MFGRLPHCDDLFLRFFDPWYNEADRKRRKFRATRPDMMQVPELVGVSEATTAPLPDAECAKTRQQLDAMLSAARGDWPVYLSVSGEVEFPWIDVFDRYWDRKRIKGIIQSSDAKDFGNDYVITVCEFGAVLGHVMRGLQPRLLWNFERPYWESALVDPRTGFVIPVFHWAIKKMSGYGVDDGFAAKVQACLRALEDGGK
jgi:hypothetical protein